MRTTICALLAVLAHASFAQTNVWSAETDLDGDARQLAVSFSIGSKLYVGTGTDAGLDGKTDFWEYDPGTGDWTQKSDFEGQSRFGAIGFSINGKGYIALGAADQSAGVYSDVWEYDPSSDPGPNAWVQKANFEGAARLGAAAFVVGGKAYVGTGQGLDGNMDQVYFNDLWEFDPVANDWTQKASLPAAARNFAVGFGIGTRGYIGTGSDADENALGDFWQYSPLSDSWVQKADFEGGARFNAVGFSMNGFGYIGTGADGVAFNDFYEYSPASNSWTQRANFGGSARISATGASVNGKGYVGTGTFLSDTKDFYEYTPESEAFAGNMYVPMRGPGSGTIFKADASGNALGVIYSFDGTSGSAPTGSIVAVNGKLYGTTYTGGLDDHGVVYELNLTGNVFAKLQDLSPHGTNGSFSGMTLAGGKLYGLSMSGSLGGGILFEYDFSSATFTKKLLLSGQSGQEPTGDLLLVGDKLFGLLMHGGANGKGTLFEYDFRNNILTKKVDFDGTANGSMPFGGLVEYDGLLYGMTNSGGTADAGTLFEYNPATGILTKKKDLGGSDGAYPHGSLTVLKGKIYGMTRIGGANGWGVIFEFDPSIDAFQKVFDMNPVFAGTGGEPRGTLTAINGRLYGLNSGLGSGGQGVLFEYDPATGFTNKTDFNGANGASPWSAVTFVRDNQTINFTAPPDKLSTDPPFQLTATGSLGLPVTFYSDNNDVLTINGSTATVVGAGVATITASIGRDRHFTVAKHQILVTKVAQTITFAPVPGKTFGDATFNLVATSSSGLPVTFASDNTSVATISGNTVTIVGAGNATITASQPGNAVYSAAPGADRTLGVLKLGQTITFNTLPAKGAADPDFNLTAVATSGLAVSYISSNTTVATISGSTVNIVGVGSTTITASQAGNGNYSAATSVDQSLVVGKGAQTITFSALATKAASDPPFQLTATASSGLSIIYTSSNPAVAQVTGSTATIVGIGTSTITARQDGNAEFEAAVPVPQLLTVAKSEQVWSAALPVTAGYLNDFVLGLTVSSGLPYTVTSSNPLVATVAAQGTSWKITPLTLGSTTLTASQGGNSQFNAAPTITSTLVVGKGVQGITFEPIPPLKVGDPAILLFATSASGQPVTIDPIIELNPSVFLTETTARPNLAKTTTITARANGNDLYLPAVVTKDITVTRGTQFVFFEPLPEKALGDVPFDIVATTSLPYEATPLITSSNPLVATVSGKTVTIVGKGTTSITANSPSDAGHNAAAPVTRVLVVRDAHSIAFGELPAKTLGDADFILTATSSAGLPVLFTSGDPAVASISGNTVKINGVGVTSITATAGDNTFTKAQVLRLLRVQNVSQTPSEQGQFWGVTSDAGTHKLGEVFKTNGDGTGYKVAKEFKADPRGAFPLSSLNLASNGRLYGTTKEGGIFNGGTVFEFDPATSSLVKTMDLTYAQNVNRTWAPNTSGKLYGANGSIMFEYDVATNTFTKTRDVSAIVNWVTDVILTANGKIFGVGSAGSLGDKKRFFEYDPAANNATAFGEFPAQNTTTPLGLVEVNGKIYGTTPYYNSSAQGELFEFDPAPNLVTIKFSFGTGSLGGGAYGLVRASNGKLYGLTQLGGANSVGSLYEFDPTTGTVTPKYHFKAGGQASTQMVLAPNGKLYGTDNNGNAGGGLFEFDPATGAFIRKVIFTAETGMAVNGNLVVYNNRIYGAGSRGGTRNAGAIFEYDYATNTISRKADFVYAPDGARPMGKLTQHSNGKLYGVTANGGANNEGIIFEMDPQSGVFTKRYDFSEQVTSTSPEAPLTLGLNGKFYGLTRLRQSSPVFGRLFEFDPADNTVRILHDFKIEEGHSPRSQVVQTPDGKLWGVTTVGGANFNGTLYEFDPATLVHTRKISFGPALGFEALGAPILASNEKFYGFTTRGGDNDKGVIYEYDRSTSTYAIKHHFSNASGTTAQATPIEVNGKLYGLTADGGANSFGVLFEYDLASGAYTKKFDFVSSVLGQYPRGSLLKGANGKLYGMTNYGGTESGGVLFEYDIATNAVTRKSDLPLSQKLGFENTSLTQAYKSFRKDQTITFPGVAAKLLGGAAFTPDATASSGLPVVFSFESDKVTLSGATVTMVKAGSVTLKANQPGDVDYNPAPQATQIFCINPTKPTISIDAGAANAEAVTLISSSSAGNQWFKNGSAVTAATGTNFSAAEAGTYSVQVTIDGCTGEMSANVPVIVTGGIQMEVMISMYPNPVSETLYVLCSDDGKGVQREVIIYDILGRRIFQSNLTSGELAIDVRPFVSGSYVLKVIHGETATQKRFMRN